jgi:uroporphyrinogen-III decarboxylase
MEPEKLKANYGTDLVFWGGGADTQRTLMFGTPAEVEDEVARRLDVFGRGGGFVFNAVHNVQANVPLPNVAAMFEALRKYNGMS